MIFFKLTVIILNFLTNNICFNNGISTNDTKPMVNHRYIIRNVFKQFEQCVFQDFFTYTGNVQYSRENSTLM